VVDLVVMEAGTVTRFPVSSVRRPLVYEPKFDGFRCLVDADSSGQVELFSRRNKPLTRAFPEITAAVAAEIPAGTMLDGEIVRWGSDNRLDFAALGRRSAAGGKITQHLAATEPCHLVVFDVLRLRGTDLRRQPLLERRTALRELVDGIERPSRIITLCPQTSDMGTATRWFDDYATVGVEGLVVKTANGRYQPGLKTWWKYKKRVTVETLLGGVTGGLNQPKELLVGRIRSDDEQLHVVGRSVPLSKTQAAQIAAVARLAKPDHPWPDEMPAGAIAGRYGATDPIAYVKVDPTVVVEVAVDMATTHGRWRHPVRFVRTRPDLEAADVPRDLDLDSRS
jgi:ATP-dependent DNA ligase